MIRILLLGKNGQLGWELRRALLPLGRVDALDAPEIDICDHAAVQAAIHLHRPSVVINATAYTAVDRAESEPEAAFAVNAHAVGFLAKVAAESGAALVHYSTDYIFDGMLDRPYTEGDAPNPLGVYGASKLAGEQAITSVDGAYLILRTSWLYSLRRDSFVTKVLGWARQQPVLRLVSDQVGNPTWARPLAETTALLLAKSAPNPLAWLTEHRGIYHLAGDGYASRLDWGRAVLENDPHPEEQCVRELQPALTVEFPTPAQRPLFSALDCTRFVETFGLRLPPWEEALQLAMQV